MTSQSTTKSAVTEFPPADPSQAKAHFDSLLAYETDCWDVHHALETGEPDFVLLDVRSPECFRKGHVPGAVNLPHGKLVERNLQQYPPETLFVVYCTGTHCNGADKGARRLASLGRYVKKMIGGIEGWKEDGFSLTSE
ncbi:MAG: rhodanese-like domain-containing protein [Bryobacteraceae bacterium]|jgi:rhodanese-related sulfurtransferase